MSQGRSRKRTKNRTYRWILLVGILALLAGLAAFFHYLQKNANLPFPANPQLTLEAEGDMLQLSWPEAAGAEGYRLEARGLSSGERWYEGECTENHGTLTDLLTAGGVELSVTPVARWHTPLGDWVREGRESLAASVSLTGVDAGSIRAQVDPDSQTLSVGVEEVREGISYQLTLRTGEGEEETLEREDGTWTLAFGEKGDYPLPAAGEEMAWSVRTVTRGDGYTLLGRETEPAVLTWEDFLPDSLALRWEETGENQYLLTWNAAAGAECVVEFRRREGDWEEAARIPGSAASEYATGILSSHTTYRWRVRTSGGEVRSPEVEIQTGYSARGCRIWPVRDLPLLDPESRERTGITVQTLELLVVQEEREGYFLVEAEGVEGLIDSRYCMINLPDYLGDLCSYEIVNSFRALYAVHGNEVPGVTGTVIPGYEEVLQEDGQYLVPYLYPCCAKLKAAGEAVQADGYRLKIYDAYRPREATHFLYEETEEILDWPLPSVGEAGETTYRQMVTGDGYQLRSFLARGGSAHNMGIALDLTLETADGTELAMQSEMHDLSRYSVTLRNNEAAELLNRYMTAAGFDILVSEWWHFQDNETRDALGLEYLQEGVSG